MKTTTEQTKTQSKIESGYCVECGAETELDCICDELNYEDGDRVVINGEVYARVHD